MQMSACHPSDQLGALEGQAFRVFGLNDHQDFANFVHERDLQGWEGQGFEQL
jgi:hypothetical protein